MGLCYFILCSFTIGLKSGLNAINSCRIYGSLQLVVSHRLLHSLFALLQSCFQNILTHFFLELSFKLVQFPAYLCFNLSNSIRYFKRTKLYPLRKIHNLFLRLPPYLLELKLQAASFFIYLSSQIALYSCDSSLHPLDSTKKHTQSITHLIEFSTKYASVDPELVSLAFLINCLSSLQEFDDIGILMDG